MKWFITGGAGFIGCHMAAKLLKDGHEVVIYDNLSRKKTETNLAWLREQGLRNAVIADVRDMAKLGQAIRQHPNIDVVLHLAAQVAVTTSVQNPRDDFETNALGTFNVCEAVRQLCPDAILLNASTNKVYGGLEDLQIDEADGRYRLADLPAGVPETRGLDFHSPYGCSKGAAEQYVHDYARIYGLRTVNFRQSCVYGTRQFGIEDQGWVAWFAIAASSGQPITIYGDGKQMRDVLYIEDLLTCYEQAVMEISRTSGQVYNIGGGPGNVLGVTECVKRLEPLLGKSIPVRFHDWRPGDQRVFVCDVSAAKRDFGWAPRTGVDEGLKRLVTWVQENVEECVTA